MRADMGSRFDAYLQRRTFNTDIQRCGRAETSREKETPMKGDTQQPAVIYARVSSVQQKTQGHGLESQETRCREFATYKGYKVVETFRDDASGSIVGRPGMIAMLAFLKKQKAPHVVIIDDISRLARSLEAHLQLRTAISSANGILQSPSIEFGEDSDSQLVENLLASVSQHQRQKNADQTKNRMRARVQGGYWCFPAPIGYRFERVSGHGKMLVRDEPLASIVQEGLEGYASGRFQTQPEVMRFFQSRPEWPSKRRSTLTTERIREMLTRPTYAGYISIPEWGLNLVQGKHEGLISFETFRAIERRMKAVANVPAKANLGEDFPLRGFITCGCCGHQLMSCWSTGRSAKYPYYLCMQKGCDHYGKSIRREQLEGDFAALLKELKPSAELMDLAAAMFRDLWDGRLAQAGQQAKSLEAQLRKLNTSIEQLVDRVVETDSPALIKTYEQRIQKMEAEKAELAEKVASCGRPLKSFDETFRTAMTFLANPCYLWESGRIEDKRAVLKLTFAERLAYTRNDGFRTAVTSSPFSFFLSLKGDEEGMVRPTGFEPVAPGLGIRCSILLSYGRMRGAV